MSTDAGLFILIFGTLGVLFLIDLWRGFSTGEATLFLITVGVALAFALLVVREYFSKSARERKKKTLRIREIPPSLITNAAPGVYLGEDQDLAIPVYLPDSVRSRHVHVLGSTG